MPKLYIWQELLMSGEFFRLFLTVYTPLLYKCVIWYMNQQIPMEQSGLISIVVGAGAAWFGHNRTDKFRNKPCQVIVWTTMNVPVFPNASLMK